MKLNPLAAAGIVLLLVACDSGPVAGGERECRPGETEPCTCADGREGVWPCGGKACECPPLPALRAEPASLDFGEVAPGEAREERVAIYNPVPREVRLRAVELWGNGEGAFALIGPVPEAIPAAGSVELVVGFTPAVPGTFVARLRVEPEDDEVAAVEVLAAGRVPGPVLVCGPNPMSLPRTYEGESSRATVVCSNLGLAGAGGDGTLPLEAPVVEGEAFSVSGAVPAEGLPVGGSVAFEVGFAPAGPGVHRGTLVVGGRGATATVELLGTAEPLPECEVAMPEELRLGVVPVNSRRDIDFEVRNLRPEAPCTVRNLRLCEGTDPAFSLPGAPFGDLRIPGGGELVVQVRFDPVVGSCGDPEGAGCVEFDLVPSPDGHRSIPFSFCEVQTEPGAFLAPNDVDFGVVRPGCATRNREIALINIQDTALELDAVDMAEGTSGGFFVASSPPLGTVIAPGMSVTFTVTYRPNDPGIDEGELLVRIAGYQEPLRARLRGEARVAPPRREHHEQNARYPIDWLFVIDNGTTMAAESGTILAELGTFPEQVRDSWIDARYAVTTTGLVAEPGGGCPGGAGGGEDGRLFPVDGSRPRWLDENTPDLLATWAANLAVGTCHTAPPQGLEAALRAITPPLATSADDPRHGESDDGNLGFLRTGHHLQIVVISDRPDASPGTVEAYEKAFQNVSYASGLRGVHVMAITGDRGTGCTAADGRAASPGDRLLDLASRTGGARSICADDWAFHLIPEVPGPRRCFPLQFEPGGDVRVWVNGVETFATEDGRRVWEYHEDQVQVCFAPDHLPAPEAEVEIEYEVACLSW
jgi:hypothetical protein